MLQSLFEQSLFARLEKQQLACEVICLVNGCTDRTAEVAAGVFERQAQTHSHSRAFRSRVASLAKRGKLNAWNEFVHSISARSARYLFLMDSDIVIHLPSTLWQMVQALETDPEAQVSVDLPCKDIAVRHEKRWRDHMSVSASEMTLSSEAQLCGQLYCIRAKLARNIYLPQHLSACEDGFIKALVCTDFVTGPIRPERIRLAPGAAHTFEAYTNPLAIFKNQKRQIMGQTIVHILVDQYFPTLPVIDRLRMAKTLKQKDTTDPTWLQRLVERHLRSKRFFWRLYPHLLTHHLNQWRRISGTRRVAALPAMAAKWAVTLFAAAAAHRLLKHGSTNYWPRAERKGLAPVAQASPAFRLSTAHSHRK
jgi:glycosyltransferase involved in cell wall biosynthesis